MRDPHSLTIRVQALDGQWETLGADRYRGVTPENVGFTVNAWGPDTCSFVLRRSPGAIHPDLTTWTPIDVEVAGILAWDGRIKETPVNDGEDPTISAQCEGWQYHLDDDVFASCYVHTRLSDWVDVRSFPTASLTEFLVAPQVQSGDGALLLSYQNGATIPASPSFGKVGTYIDLGPGNVGKRATIQYTTSNNTTSIEAYVGYSDATPGSASGALIANCATASGLASFTINGRYVTIWMQNGTGAPVGLGADVWFRASSVIVYGNSAYESGNASILKADTVVKDALTIAPLLSPDISQISAGTFSIPEFALDGSHSPREVINAVNAYENYETRLLAGRQIAYRARASAPIYSIGEWSGAEFQDASANSGDEIYNRVTVEGTGPDGQQMSVNRWVLTPQSLLAPLANPSATVDVLNWSTTGTLTRDTGVFNTSPASFQLSGGSGAASATSAAVAQAFTKGYRYLLTGWIALNLVTTAHRAYVAVDINSVEVARTPLFDNGFSGTFSLNWTERTGGTNYRVRVVEAATGSFAVWFDDLTAGRIMGTLADRRGFTRTKILPVGSSITTTSGGRIGDLYLASHSTTPFKGGFQVVGLGGVRRVLGGAAVHPAHIQVGQLVRCTHRTDPDTGGWARDGRIASLSYNHDALTSSVALDENRAGLETLLSRLAVVQAQRRA